MPFWFWNDDLDEAELLRQIDDFEQHGVHGFVIHPRVGLPRTLGWMSENLLHFYDVAIAAVRDFLRTPCSLQEVIFCCFSESDLALYQSALAR